MMALDHSRLGPENKINFWETNQAEFFALDKFTLQNLANKFGGVNINLITKYSSERFLSRKYV